MNTARKTVTLQIRMTADQLKAVRTAAGRQVQTASTFGRSVLLKAIEGREGAENEAVAAVLESRGLFVRTFDLIAHGKLTPERFRALAKVGSD